MLQELKRVVAVWVKVGVAPESPQAEFWGVIYNFGFLKKKSIFCIKQVSSSLDTFAKF
jgi:hypothetical protein